MCALQVLFQRFDRDGDGYVTRFEFEEVYHSMFTDGDDVAKLDAMYKKMGVQGEDSLIDYVSFVDHIRIQDLPDLTSKCREHGSLAAVRPCRCCLCFLCVRLQRSLSMSVSLES